MKKKATVFAAILLILIFSCGTVFAEKSDKDYSLMTLDELSQERNILLEELTKINAAQGNLLKTKNPSEILGKIKDLFPDENFALAVRDACGKFSIEQEVTQEDLDKVWIMNSSYVSGPIADLTGISLLRECDWFEFRFIGTHFPDEMQYATWLKYIYFNHSELVEIPDWIDHLSDLSTLEIAHSHISSLPESICNLPNLRGLNISNTNVAKLPENIGNLTSLTRLDISHTKITRLPDSIYNLSLETIKMQGLPIK